EPTEEGLELSSAFPRVTLSSVLLEGVEDPDFGVLLLPALPVEAGFVAAGLEPEEDEAAGLGVDAGLGAGLGAAFGAEPVEIFISLTYRPAPGYLFETHSKMLQSG
ncbi:MAG: hypothetical protein KC800_34400, partial [Candidatus Eremiobacteraeota bacterium]|nr:hypothetical protein [Candidatus Eremiobacteraeota bacterium]